MLLMFTDYNHCRSMLRNPPTFWCILICCTLAFSGCQTSPFQSMTNYDRSTDLCNKNQHKAHERYSADFSGNGRSDLLVWGEKSKDACMLLSGTPWQISLNAHSERLAGEFFQVETRVKATADILTVDPRTGNNKLFISRLNGGTISFHGRSISPKVFNRIGNSRVTLFQGELNHDGREIDEVIAWWKQSGELKIISFQQPHDQEATTCLIDESLISHGMDLNVHDYNGDGRDDLRFWVKDEEDNIVARTFNTLLTGEQQYRFMDEQGKIYHPHECPIKP